MSPLSFHHFQKAKSIALIIGLFFVATSALVGKVPFFLYLNADFGAWIDKIMQAFSFAGEWVSWVVLLFLVIVVFKKINTLPLLLASFLIVTILVQTAKRTIPDMARPVKEIGSSQAIHTTPGITLHDWNSFPSGHTATAFTIYFLLCMYIPNNKTVIFGLLLASLVGYSRVYLAQHFPVDVGGGILAAVLAVLLAIKVQLYFDRKRKSPLAS
ncbi:MAG: phosphatase PAP2 family protein [Bacteroidetes bacterium]|jgi:membrane-associated phospholipid phosphatase|nr:MAG: phosphatase PAP2 family protein [Bacteroidota bacterium]TAE72889.1 MAG: phosphatase PAP2 family protein [Bacteroidota bacterium]TAF94030.1 MAG: phosphatase PAP2 family protein [Bacteroidota bacterium]